MEKLLSKRDPKDCSTSKSSYPLHLNALCLSTRVSPPSLLRYLDDVRPDIKFATTSPKVALFKHVKRLLNYLEASKDLCHSDLQVHAYIDASYAIHTGSNSHYGIALCLGEQGHAFQSRSCAVNLPKQNPTPRTKQAQTFLIPPIFLQNSFPPGTRVYPRRPSSRDPYGGDPE